ncbi:hypothetical protein CA260_10455 [Dyella jiangningensis]|uniref:Uncharacterized protein n=2 Tax=Dyella jiangningensis TaxID=1379159 RepID=A0A328PF72_9GAMM|nr:hypothetical protein CA260_10455 [Dyella jiangningensis]
MDQVRDILFGSLIREYDRRFQELEARFKAEIERVENEHGRRMAAIEERLEAGAEKFAMQLRQEGAARAAAIEDLDHRGSQALRTQRGEWVAAIEQVEANVGRNDARSREVATQLQSNLDAAVRTLREALSAERDALRGDKLGREDLADMMAELSMRLRGTLDLP